MARPPEEETVSIRGLVFGMICAVPVWAVIIAIVWLVVQASRGR